jgi:cell wall-associated NlpC family hydrolase
MRFSTLVFTALAALMMAAPVAAEENADASLADGIKAQAQPLLKALSLIGTPYKFGGNNPEKGLDCSGFVKHVYKTSADISLPRSAAEMSRQGETVAQSDLKPGDLVFFNTRKQPNSHVGIYAGDGTFVHASSSQSKKVMVSRINEKYWSSRFNGARRILPLD